MKIISLDFVRENDLFSATLCEIHEDIPLLKSEEILSNLELQRAKLFKSNLRKQQFLNGRYCAKRAISSRINTININEIEILNGVFSQPVLMNSFDQKLQVSITHTDQLAAAVVFPEVHPLAIDIETIQPKRNRTIESLLSPSEIELKKKIHFDNAAANTLMWTARESLGKILRTGLAASPTIFEIETITEVSLEWVEVYFSHFPQYKAIASVKNGHVFSLCMPKKSLFNIEEFEKNHVKNR